MRNFLLVACLLILCSRVIADPIHDAAANGDVAGVQRLLTSDTKLVNARAANGATPLLWACIRGQLEVARLLVERGADVNLAQGDGWTPLHAAVCDGNDAAHIGITRLLLEHGAKLEARNGIGWTALHAAALKGNTATMGVLLEQKADVGAKDNTGGTALHIAAEQGRIEAVALLLDKGADAGVKDKTGKSPAERALANAYVPVVERLLASKQVSLQIENVAFADALHQVFAAAGMTQGVKSDIAVAVSLHLDNVPFPVALRAVLQAAGGRDALTFAGGNGALRVTRTETEQTPEAVAEPVVTADPRYRFYKTISLSVLNNYLARSVTHLGLCSSWPEPASSTLDDDIRMLVNIGAKFVGEASYAWGAPQDNEGHFRRAKEAAMRVHKADPEIVLQACVFEAIYKAHVEQIAVPGWLFQEFGLPVTKRNFDYTAMLYDNGELRNHWTQDSSVPDMSKLETRMFFTYCACRYIDAGFEAIHFGQVHLMDHKDPEHRCWLGMLTRVRKYAAQKARRRFVLCDVNTHGVVCNGRLLFDFHSYPLRMKEVKGTPQQAQLAVGYGDSLYYQSAGGIAPSGWACNQLPYMVGFDNTGTSGKPGQPGQGIPWVWGYDEISWFAHQSEPYRNSWLPYALKWVAALHQNGWVQMPTRKVLAEPVNGVAMYQANTRSKACPNGFSQEETIKAIWATSIPARP